MIRLTDIDAEAEHAVMGLFRSLYVRTESTSFRSIMRLLKGHLRPSSPHPLRHSRNSAP
jgi:hypothetical protein